ncbi:hypothetical protein GCK32_006157 [Trichostrongylus colubriformis]|uniref:G-protein coupled receptors family 1 profile domain-containing protein n=1 Tax=Trichostrongylus colubriformis TaxID=6319 RepID=A0AAN8IGD8_TRICO
MSHAYLIVVFAAALLVFVFGLFGNIMVISVVRKHKELRTKHSILLSFLCFYQSLVLLLDLVASLRNLLEDVTDRWTCFYSLLPLSFFNNVQLVLILIISLDLTFLVLKPAKYNAIQLFPYTILVQIPCALFAMGLLTAGIVLIRPDEVISCDFIMAHPAELTLVRHLLVIGVCIATILVYACISFMMWFKDWQNTRKTDGFLTFVEAKRNLFELKGEKAYHSQQLITDAKHYLIR